MAGETMRFRNPAGHAGLLNNLVALGASLAAFVESRIGLFAHESKGALLHFFVLAGALVGALLLLATGYIFLVVGVIFLIARAADVSWIWVALGAAGVHFLLALCCGLVARHQLVKPMFTESLAELKRDREWLKRINDKSHSRD